MHQGQVDMGAGGSGTGTHEGRPTIGDVIRTRSDTDRVGYELPVPLPGHPFSQNPEMCVL